jgi:hypothetical protein
VILQRYAGNVCLAAAETRALLQALAWDAYGLCTFVEECDCVVTALCSNMRTAAAETRALLEALASDVYGLCMCVEEYDCVVTTRSRSARRA